MKISFFPHQAHCYAFGGFEIQMLDAAAAIRKCGVEIEFYDWWNRESSHIVHHWGTGYPHLDNIRWAKKTGQRVVITALLYHPNSFIEKFKRLASRWIAQGRTIREEFILADRIVVLNELQAIIAKKVYDADSNKLRIVPNIVSDSFLKQSDSISKSDYWILPGNVCQRKNQIAAAKAALNVSIPLKIVGNVLPGEEDYSNKLQKLVAENSILEWIPGQERDSSLYQEIFSRSRGLLLPSLSEQQPICILEAAALRIPIILGDRDYAKQIIFNGAVKVSPSNVLQIGQALVGIETGKKNGKLLVDINSFSSDNVGKQYVDIYSELL
jgi:glycosyltransferase involved in cell wall biosynthesis